MEHPSHPSCNRRRRSCDTATERGEGYSQAAASVRTDVTLMRSPPGFSDQESPCFYLVAFVRVGCRVEVHQPEGRGAQRCRLRAVRRPAGRRFGVRRRDRLAGPCQKPRRVGRLSEAADDAHRRGVWSRPVAGLGDDPDASGRLDVERGGTRGKLVRLQQIGHDVDVRLVVEAAGVVERHRAGELTEQIGERRPVPAAHESCGHGRPILVAAAAGGFVGGLAAGGLRLGVDAVLDGAGGRYGRLCPSEDRRGGDDGEGGGQDGKRRPGGRGSMDVHGRCQRRWSKTLMIPATRPDPKMPAEQFVCQVRFPDERGRGQTPGRGLTLPGGLSSW